MKSVSSGGGAAARARPAYFPQPRVNSILSIEGHYQQQHARKLPGICCSSRTYKHSNPQTGMTPQAVAPKSDASLNGPLGQVSAVAAQGAAETTQFVTFAIGDDEYGVDIMAVREIKGWTDVTHLPRQPDYVRGVLNLRGVMVPIIDLRCRFGQGRTEATPIHIAIIVEIDGAQVGLLADRVLDIVSFDPKEVQPVPQVIQGTRIAFLSGLVTIEGAMIALVDLPHLLNDADGGPSSERH
jgi:purine-binding chemotaxis protein CheW